MTDSVLAYKEIANLSNAGVDTSSISFNAVTMNSDKYICVRNQGKVQIFDFNNFYGPQSFNIRADYAVMHQTKNIIALKANNVIQIVNLDTKQTLSQKTFPNESILYLKWIDSKTLAFITQTYRVKTMNKILNLKSEKIYSQKFL